MKHIFTLHSPITFLCSYLVIQKEELNAEDVILLSSGYKVPTDKYKIVESPGSYSQGFFSSLSNLNFPKYFDRQISNITQGEKFVAYIDLMSYHQRILVTHQDCTQFHFIEEGSLTYLDNDNLNSIAHIDLNGKWRVQGLKDYFNSIKWYISKAIRGYSKRLMFMPFNYRGYAFFSKIKYYSLSKAAYAGLDNSQKVVLDISLDNEMLSKLSYDVDVSDAIVWIDDSLVCAYPRFKDGYLKALKQSIEIVKKIFPDKKHAIKLRPRWDKEQSLTYGLLSKHFADIEILPDETIMEAALLNSKNCYVIGNVSIVLFYASQIGLNVYSLFPLIENTEDLLFNNNMTSIWENIQSVESLSPRVLI